MRRKPGWRQQYYRRQPGLRHLPPLSGLARTLGRTTEPMRTLAAVNTVFAAALLLFGALVLFALGMTGLFLLLPGIVFALIAAVAWTRARASVPLALAADGVLAYVALGKVNQALGLGPSAHMPRSAANFAVNANTIDLLVFGVALALVAFAVLAVLLDWKTVQAAKWF